MKQYTVTGMSCAACSARVEKAVGAVPGVTACSVSLLTNSMGVEGTASDQAVIAAVEAAGYGASLKGAPAQGSASPAAAEDALADHDTPSLTFVNGSCEFENYVFASVNKEFGHKSCIADVDVCTYGLSVNPLSPSESVTTPKCSLVPVMSNASPALSA